MACGGRVARDLGDGRTYQRDVCRGGENDHSCGGQDRPCRDGCDECLGVARGVGNDYDRQGGGGGDYERR